MRRIETQRQQWPHRVADLSSGAPDGSGTPTVTGTEGMSALEVGTALGVGSGRDQSAESIAQNAAGNSYEFGGSGPGSTNNEGQPASSWDCSGLVGDMYSATMGLDPNAPQTTDSQGERFNTTSDMAGMGFERGYEPGAFNIGNNPAPGSEGHMSAELPSGTRAESRGSGVQVGDSARQMSDPAYTEQWHLPDATQTVVNQMTSPSDAGSSAANKS